MDSPHFIDTIKSEKANALARYQTLTNIKKLLQLTELFAMVALISWSSSHLPSVFKSSSEYMLTFSSYFMNQHVVFLVGNLIVVICYILSRDSGNNFGDSGIQTIPSEVTESTESEIPAVLNEVIVKPASEQRFKRTRSEKVKSEISVRPRRELRRSVTEMRRGVAVGSGGESPLNSVEKLSNEEFRIRVEAFILKQQRLLKQQIMVEDGV